MKVKFLHAGEYLFGSFFVCLFIGGENEQVVHVYEKPSFGDHVSEGVVHEALKGCWGVHHSKEHYHGLEKPSVGGKGSFPLVSIFDAYIIISPSYIELGEEFCSLEFVEEVRYQQEGISIVDHVFVQVPVILTRLEFSIFLLYEKEGRCLWGGQGSDLS